MLPSLHNAQRAWPINCKAAVLPAIFCATEADPVSARSCNRCIPPRCTRESPFSPNCAIIALPRTAPGNLNLWLRAENCKNTPRRKGLDGRRGFFGPRGRQTGAGLEVSDKKQGLRWRRRAANKYFWILRPRGDFHWAFMPVNFVARLKT